ncbi:MAG: hypothetical protein HY537_00510 [Deltaproteobacteria bacterium]|nr:hypothetical protein [Deltaproteobacteria bacterium]
MKIRSHRTKIFLGGTCLLLLNSLFLSGCGERYCVAGFGQCADMFNQSNSPAPAAQPAAPSDMVVSATPTEVFLLANTTLSVKGGRPNYTFTISKFTLPDRTQIDPRSADAGSIKVTSYSEAVYTAGARAGWADIQVRDADNKLSAPVRVKITDPNNF